MNKVAFAFLYATDDRIVEPMPVLESEFRIKAKAQGLVDLTAGPDFGPEVVQPDYMGRWIESLEVS